VTHNATYNQQMELFYFLLIPIVNQFDNIEVFFDDLYGHDVVAKIVAWGWGMAADPISRPLDGRQLLFFFSLLILT
jgi:hypothetical protein